MRETHSLGPVMDTVKARSSKSHGDTVRADWGISVLRSACPGPQYLGASAAAWLGTEPGTTALAGRPSQSNYSKVCGCAERQVLTECDQFPCGSFEPQLPAWGRAGTSSEAAWRARCAAEQPIRLGPHLPCLSPCACDGCLVWWHRIYRAACSSNS